MAAGSKDERTEVTERVRSLLESQPLAVLSSSAQGHPYTNLVAFAATEDLRRVVFATMRATRKYQNMHEDPRVSLLIDDRSNRVSDIRDALAVTAQGDGQALPKPARGLGPSHQEAGLDLQGRARERELVSQHAGDGHVLQP